MPDCYKVHLSNRSYNEVLKYYKKMEKARLKGYEKAFHRGQDGVLPVEFVPKK